MLRERSADGWRSCRQRALEASKEKKWEARQLQRRRQTLHEKQHRLCRRDASDRHQRHLAKQQHRHEPRERRQRRQQHHLSLRDAWWRRRARCLRLQEPLLARKALLRRTVARSTCGCSSSWRVEEGTTRVEPPNSSATGSLTAGRHCPRLRGLSRPGSEHRHLQIPRQDVLQPVSGVRGVQVVRSVRWRGKPWRQSKPGMKSCIV